MRVLIVPKDFPSEIQPQAGIFVLRRMQALAEIGHELSVLRIVPAAPPLGRWQKYTAIPEYETISGFPVHTVRALIPPRFIGVEYVPLLLHRALMREIERFQPSLVHASFLIPTGHLVTQQRVVPSVVTSHGADVHTWPNRRPGMRRACVETLRDASRVTAVSHFLRERIQQLVPRDVDVVWNGGDERFFFPRDRWEARSALQLPRDRSVVAFAGTLMRAKGLYELIEAAASLQPRPLLALAGEGPDREDLEREARDRGVDLRLFGRMDSAGVATLFAAADVVTLPSYAEGLPNVVCEAMLAQRAVVASTAGGTPEILRDGETGFLVQPRRADQLAQALQRTLGDDDLRERIAAAAVTFAREHLTWRVSARGYDRVYRQAIAS